MSAKVTIRETDGTEYQLKKRIAEMVRTAGFSRKVERGLHQMLGVKLQYALKIIDLASGDFDRGKLKREGPPECACATYPVRDMRSSPKLFGYSQDWDRFPTRAVVNA